MRILVADDEIDMARVLTAILEYEHYAVDTVHDGRAALDYALDGDYDCLVLDIMMPKLSGLEVLRSLRAVNNTVPVLFLTAKGDAADRIAGLDGGADDYLAKPFNMGEFLARVRACARRSTSYIPTTLEAGDLTLDRATYTLSAAGSSRSVRLPNKEYLVMEQLMRTHDHYLSPDRLREHAWGYDAYVGPNVIWTYVSKLRHALKTVESTCRIESSRGRGYILVSNPADTDS